MSERDRPAFQQDPRERSFVAAEQISSDNIAGMNIPIHDSPVGLCTAAPRLVYPCVEPLIKLARPPSCRASPGGHPCGHVARQPPKLCSHRNQSITVKIGGWSTAPGWGDWWTITVEFPPNPSYHMIPRLAVSLAACFALMPTKSGITIRVTGRGGSWTNRVARHTHR